MKRNATTTAQCYELEIAVSSRIALLTEFESDYNTPHNLRCKFDFLVKDQSALIWIPNNVDIGKSVLPKR